MKTEFLILTPDKESFCNSEKAYIDLLKVDSLFTITPPKLKFKTDSKVIEARFQVKTEKVKLKNERYFNVLLECDNTESVEEFYQLCERIKTLSLRIAPNETLINTIWDDVGTIYAEKSYPLIWEVENLMRKLITKFMLITVGVSWSKDTMTPDLSKKIEKFEENDSYISDLFKLDFIQLSNFLFDKKRDLPDDELNRILAVTNFSAEDQEKIRKYLPRSNWEKHFYDIIKVKDSSLITKWNLLYKLRNKVAHNRHLNGKDFREIEGLSRELKKIITEAIEKLGEISIKEEERGYIIRSYDSGTSVAYAAMAEAAIAKHFGEKDYLIIPQSHTYDYRIDFIAERDGLRYGIEVKSVSLKSVDSNFSVIKRMQMEHWKSLLAEKIVDKIKVYFVMRPTAATHYAYGLLADSTKKFEEELGPNFEAHSGYLDEDTFIEVLPT